MINRLYKRTHKIRTFKQANSYHKLVNKLYKNGTIGLIDASKLKSYASGFQFAAELSRSGFFDEL